MSIPHILHRVWLDDPILGRFAQWWDEWKRLHPGWDHRDWRATADLPPLRNHQLFDAAPQRMPGDWKRFRSDIVRLELLYRYGGVYIDADCEPLRPIDDLIDGRECVVGFSPQTNRQGEHPITNAVMAATPRHPFIGACLDGLAHAADEHAGKTLAQVLGPWHLTRTYEAGGFGGIVTVLAHEEMYGGPWLRHLWANRTLGRKGGV